MIVWHGGCDPTIKEVWKHFIVWHGGCDPTIKEVWKHFIVWHGGCDPTIKEVCKPGTLGVPEGGPRAMQAVAHTPS